MLERERGRWEAEGERETEMRAEKMNGIFETFFHSCSRKSIRGSCVLTKLAGRMTKERVETPRPLRFNKIDLASQEGKFDSASVQTLAIIETSASPSGKLRR